MNLKMDLQSSLRASTLQNSLPHAIVVWLRIICDFDYGYQLKRFLISFIGFGFRALHTQLQNSTTTTIPLAPHPKPAITHQKWHRRKISQVQRQVRARPLSLARPADAPTEQRQAKFELGIALTLAAWPALTLAVQQEWGGAESADKRAWLAGAVADLFASRPSTDAADVEDLLLQVLGDEFNVALEDGSEAVVAAAIIALRHDTAAGEFTRVDQLWRAWKERGGKEGVTAVRVGGAEDGDEGDEDEDDEEDGDEDGDEAEEEGDVEMGDTPAATSSSRRRTEPEVDEDGFTKVVHRRR
jgi:pre-rRNA-processing protein TSR2